MRSGASSRARSWRDDVAAGVMASAVPREIGLTAPGGRGGLAEPCPFIVKVFIALTIVGA